MERLLLAPVVVAEELQLLEAELLPEEPQPVAAELLLLLGRPMALPYPCNP